VPDRPTILIVLAGPNGAGKSTYYELFLKKLGWPFVNADLLAKDHFGSEAGAHAMAAARMADEERRRLLAAGESFIMETVFSDASGHNLAFFREAREAGYRVEACFIGLESADLSAGRVQGRVAEGGHDVPLGRIIARYPRTLKNLAALCDFADRLTLFDNSLNPQPYRLVAELEVGFLLALCDPLPAWTNGLGLENRLTSTTHRFPL
jgi:predicted ABC-type ATPase